MFTNPGQKLPVLAKIYFVVRVVFDLLLGGLAGIRCFCIPFVYDLGSLGALLAALVSVLVCALLILVSYIICVFLYGFGEVVSASRRI